MFEILKAVMALQATAGNRLRWRITPERYLVIEVPLTADEVEFAEGMTALFAPVEEQPTDAVHKVLSDVEDLLRNNQEEPEERWRRRGVEVVRELERVIALETTRHHERSVLQHQKGEVGRIVFQIGDSQPAEGSMQERQES